MSSRRQWFVLTAAIAVLVTGLAAWIWRPFPDVGPCRCELTLRKEDPAIHLTAESRLPTLALSRASRIVFESKMRALGTMEGPFGFVGLYELGDELYFFHEGRYYRSAMRLSEFKDAAERERGGVH